MRLEDMGAVLRIEQASQPAPWLEKIFVEELAREWARLIVVEAADEDGATLVVAYCNYWLVADELQLLNICCAPEYRRQGHGGAMMHHMLEVARKRECRLITLEVRASNRPAIAMYEGFGFAPAGVRAAYYADNQEDALVMLLHIGTAD